MGASCCQNESNESNRDFEIIMKYDEKLKIECSHVNY